MTCLIIEDEQSLGEGLVFNFQAEGYQTVWIQDGLEAIKYIETNHSHMCAIILDIMLPNLDGFEILKQTRFLAERIPILVLSAKGLEGDKIKALELGADDYMTKPFSLTELILRIRGLIKKQAWYQKQLDTPTSASGEKTAFGNSFFQCRTLILETDNNNSIRLSPTEGLLIKTFLEKPNEILSRSDLLEWVWNCTSPIETRTVDVFISKLRKHIEPNPAKPQFLISIRGSGYVYVTDDQLRKQLLNS